MKTQKNDRQQIKAELSVLAKHMFTKPAFQAGSVLSLLLAVIGLVTSFVGDPLIFIIGSGIFLLILAGWAIGLVHTCQRSGVIEPASKQPCFPALKSRLGWVAALLVLGIGVVMGGLALLAGWVSVSLPKCPPADAESFATGTSEGWLVRYEGDLRLGEALTYSSPRCRGRDIDALEFEFQLGSEYDSAQIGLDGSGVSLIAGMDAWVYSEKGSLETLAVQCFLMEGEGQGWAWHETAPLRLSPGRWQEISCPADKFSPPGWANPPQFIGLLFADSAGSASLDRVYVAGVSIR